MPHLNKPQEQSPAGLKALAAVQRKGFRLAVIGRSVALCLLAIVFLIGYQYPVNLAIWATTSALGLAGLGALLTLGRSYETPVKYVFFTTDVLLVTALVAFAPLSSGDDIPQNLVFLTSRANYYYLVLAASILTLSPALVLWTGVWGAVGLACSTTWIVSNMTHVTRFSDLPLAPSRDVFLRTVLNPDFIAIESRIEDALILVAVTAIASLAVHRARRTVLARISAEEQERHLRRVFGKYVPATVIADLETDGHLAPQTRDASLLYLDIEGFTTLSERLPPEQIVDLLNGFFASVAELVTTNGGLVVNYFGDAVIAAFNAPRPLDNFALGAVTTAREILRIVDTQRFNGEQLSLRIGIATGLVAFGTVGSDERLSFTLYGDTVNLSQRLEALNKEFKTRCLVCGETFKSVSPRLNIFEPLGSHAIRNRSELAEVFAMRAD